MVILPRDRLHVTAVEVLARYVVKISIAYQHLKENILHLSMLSV